MYGKCYTQKKKEKIRDKHERNWQFFEMSCSWYFIISPLIHSLCAFMINLTARMCDKINEKYKKRIRQNEGQWVSEAGRDRKRELISISIAIKILFRIFGYWW